MNYVREFDPEEEARLLKVEKKAARSRRIKIFVAGFVSFWLLGVVGLTIFFKVYLDDMAKAEIEKRGSAALGAPLKIEKFTIGMVPSLNARATGVTFSYPAQSLTGKAQQARVTLGASLLQIIQGGALGVVTVELDSPRISVEKAESVGVPTASGKDGQGPVIIPLEFDRDVGLRFEIKNGNLDYLKVAGKNPAADLTLEGLNVTAQIPNLRKMDGDFKFACATVYKQDTLAFRFPIKLATKVKLQDDTVTLTDAAGEFFGLSFKANGWQQIRSGRADWKLTGLIPELSALPIPPSFLPQGKWSGKLSSAIDATSLSRDKGWNVHAQLDASQIRGTTHFESHGTVLDGSLAGNASFDVTASMLADRTYEIKLNKGYAAADLGGMEINNPGLFKKPKTTPFVFYFLGAGNQKSIHLEKFDLKFANLAAHATGDLSLEPGKMTSLTVVVDKTDLAGWEAFVAPLAGAAMKGSLQANLQVKGDLDKPETMSLGLAPLSLENFSATANWTSEDRKTSLTGPFRANALISLQAVGKDLRGANLKMNADLSGMRLWKDQTFDKRTNLPLLINVTGSQKEQQIELKASTISIGTSTINLTGQILNPQKPLLNLRMNAPSLNLVELASLSPKSSGVGLSGTANAIVDLQGTYDFKLGIEGSPLRVNASTNVRIPSYKMVRSKAAAVPATPTTNPKAPAPAAEPLLPNWPIAKNSIVRSDIMISQLTYGDLPIQNLHINSVLNRGTIDGTVLIDQIFGGRLHVGRFRSNLAIALPDSVADIDYTNINMQSAATFASPEWKDLIKGAATGKMTAVIPYPSSPTFVDCIQSSGTIQIKNGFFSTVQVDKMINEKIAQIPGVGSQAPANSKGVTADITADYKLDKKVMTLSRFIFLTPEKNELRATGTLGLDKSINLSGTAYLATAPVGGSVRSANSDTQGRFVIPLKLQGNLMKPEVSFAQETIAQLAKKTAETELKKGVQDKLNQVQDAIKKNGVQGLKDLFK